MNAGPKSVRRIATNNGREEMALSTLQPLLTIQQHTSHATAYARHASTDYHNKRVSTAPPRQQWRSRSHRKPRRNTSLPSPQQRRAKHTVSSHPL